MPRITDLPLVGRVLASFVVVVAALALVTAFAVTGQRRDARTAAELARVARLTRDAQQLKFLDADMSAWQTTYVLDIRREGLSQAKPTATSRKVFLEDKAALEALLKRVDVASMTAAERSAFARVRTAFADFFAADARIWAEYVAARPGYRMRAENAFYGGGIGTYDVLLKRTDALRALLDRRVTKLSATAHDQASSRERTTLVVGLAAVLLALAIALIVARSITRPLREILRAAESLADGDTEHAIALRSRDELGRVAEAFRRVLARFRELGSAAERISGGDLTVTVAPRSERDTLGTAFAAMVADLRALVGRVADGAGRVGSASESVATSSSETQRAIDEIASAVGEVAHGAQRQTSAMESARALTDDVVGATTASARDASETVRSAGQARELIEQGVEAVGHATTAMERVRAATEQATEAMNELGAKGERIGGIVDTISSIAGQTNLLALNAAIEAARAGDQGRGFAVVADEVRKLAEESEHAAGSIAALVAEIQSETRRVVDVVGEGERRTHQGSDTVLAARDSFERIGAAVDDVSSRMEHVAASLERITTSAQDMQQNISEVASVSEQASASTQQVAASTQETSASAQEISASAHDLAATATELTKAVARFRLG